MLLVVSKSADCEPKNSTDNFFNQFQSKKFTRDQDGSKDDSNESLRSDEMALLFTLHTHFALCNLDIEDIEDRVSSEHKIF
jgi:hypothetical protein